MEGIYLGAYKAYHPGYNIVYQDINGKRDIGGDMMDIDLSPYDFIIATPPCNFYSKACNKNRHSHYAINTAHLLPDILFKLENLGKPFIVENVRNYPMFSSMGLIPRSKTYVYFIGRHTYWSSIPFNTFVYQEIDDQYVCLPIKYTYVFDLGINPIDENIG